MADETNEAIAVANKIRLARSVQDLTSALTEGRAYHDVNMQPDERIYQNDRKNIALMINYLDANIPGLLLHAKSFDTPTAFAVYLRDSLDEPRHERALIRMGENEAHYTVVDYMIKVKCSGPESNQVSVMAFDPSSTPTAAVALGVGRLGNALHAAVPQVVASYTLSNAQTSPKDCIVFALLYATKLCLRREIFKSRQAVTRGHVTLDMQNLDARQIVADATEQVRPLCDGRVHRLTVHVSHEPALVIGDLKRLVQVLTNLLITRGNDHCI
ncbi:YopJ family acetyltransferase [Noviherbaspirillum sp. Root189]|uniref:YopJ family acetyltransferase n=1 Tax=Noviherbaspirillum sp. Root189 TaxID=1736487 RepID=UPI00070AB2FD|nr:YopJ family acetyltransferase [Noviherbaspirillum sp. Root189]KRB67864.1 hypothetical protein ASE07_09365 [Noviherbaspirillum sp. Root189]